MGIDIRTATVISGAKSLGADFSRTATIGRLSLFNDRQGFDSIYALHRVAPPPAAQYSETFFQALGAANVHSFDASSYEGATHLLDMNAPLPSDLRKRYSLVVDGGTLEHVFNAPQAFRNCMEMLDVGGFFVSSGPCNNQMGHGFWQFSPELAFRIFSRENGFETLAVLVQEAHFNLWREANGPYYLVRDPAELGERVMLRNCAETFIHVIARRTAIKPIFETPPQQSDYSATWKLGHAPVFAPNRFSPVRMAKVATPAIVKRALKGCFPGRAYRRLTNADVMRGLQPACLNRFNDIDFYRSLKRFR
jgi:hypothetical protein